MVAVGLWLATAGLAAEEFRIETTVFVGDAKQPSSHNLTLLRQGVIYDFQLLDPREATIFEPAADRIRILRPGDRVQTVLTTGQLDEAIRRVQRLALEDSDPLRRFLAQPKFDEKFDRSTGRLVLSSPLLEYRLDTIEVPDRRRCEAYADFSDWYARLNALAAPKAMPPFARLRVNEVLFQLQRMPQDVTLTLRLPDGQTTQLRSAHTVAWRLEEADHQRLAQAQAQSGSFTVVDFATYRRTLAQRPVQQAPQR